MSMEDAILELAAGMKEVAAAIRAGFSSPQMMDGFNKVSAAFGGGGEDRSPENAIKAADKNANPEAIENGGRQMPAEDAAALRAKNEANKSVEPDAELEAAVSKVEDDALAAPLEYTKDVRPVLLQLSKAKGKDELLSLLKKYGAKNGEAIKADDFAKIVADANALIAG